jgi:CubicO group peptidase (beta-lactamase class C family)
VGELSIEVDPAAAGFSSERLARIDRHFQRYVDDGRLPGWLAAISRDGQIVHTAAAGHRDLEAGEPVTAETVWRIFSMTKPITSVAAMMLYERCAFELSDPIADYLPEFSDMRVYSAGQAANPVTVPATEPIRVWHLLTHTAGLTYGFHRTHPVDAMYRERGFDAGIPQGLHLAEACAVWAQLPLLFQPGREWTYSVASDVLGRLVEVVSGQRLDEFFAEHITGPLGMVDTAFQSADPRLAALYTADPVTGLAVRNEGAGAAATRVPTAHSGGGGLVSTAADYHRFTRMLLGHGQYGGVRLLGSRTVDYMTRNHLPGGADLESFGRPLHAEVPLRGTGFGLGFSVVVDPVGAKNLGSVGEYAWGGAASTAFWVDPVERVTALFFTQLVPSSTHPIRSQLRQLVYQALVD